MGIVQVPFLRTVSRTLQRVQDIVKPELLAVQLKNAVSEIRSHRNTPVIVGASLFSGLAAYGGYSYGATSRQSTKSLDLSLVPEQQEFLSLYEMKEPPIPVLRRFFDPNQMDLLTNVPGAYDSKFYEQVFDDAGLYVDLSSDYKLPNFIRMECRRSAIEAYMRTLRQSEVKSVEWEEVLSNLSWMYGNTVALIELGGFRKLE